ncbi:MULTISPECIES: hypothetical protein [unclassified Streptomyces]|uniref:hypothetical protein n=1 Tax=unclassified Streptomyces TaxID=2593676 RepID=UPI002E2C6D13|nr:hypothetical protein [Streptomyces sp. NBC_01439]
MTLPLMGLFLLVSAAAVPACILVVVLMLRKPPRSLPGICAVLALIFVFSAAAVYCYGWFSVALGGPFPELCEDGNGPGAQLAGLKQEYWPLRNACIYSDGSTVEHVSRSINLFVYVSAGLAVVLACAAVFLNRRARHVPVGNP